MVKARERFAVALLVVALGFGGYWVGRAIVHTGHEYSGAAAEVTTNTSAGVRHAADVRRRRRNVEVLGGLSGAGALYVILPAIFGIPERRRRRRLRNANASRV